jgi:hypothetical protein
VWRTFPALGDLARDKADFKAISATSPDATRGVLACPEAARSGAPAMAGLEGMLRELAERGFVAINNDTDLRAALVSHIIVGGVVLENTFAPAEAWGERRKVVLAASSQCMRLLLASELAQDPPPFVRARRCALSAAGGRRAGDSAGRAASPPGSSDWGLRDWGALCTYLFYFVCEAPVASSSRADPCGARRGERPAERRTCAEPVSTAGPERQSLNPRLLALYNRRNPISDE